MEFKGYISSLLYVLFSLLLASCSCEQKEREIIVPSECSYIDSLRYGYPCDKAMQIADSLRQKADSVNMYDLFASSIEAYAYCYQGEEELSETACTKVIDGFTYLSKDSTDYFFKEAMGFRVLRAYCNIIRNSDKAIEDLETCFDYYQNYKNINLLVKVDLYLSEIYKNRKDFVKSLYYLDNIEFICDSINALTAEPTWVLYLLSDVMNVSTELGDFKMANHAMVTASAFYDEAIDDSKAYYLLQRAKCHFYQQEYMLAEYAAGRLQDMSKNVEYEIMQNREHLLWGYVLKGLALCRLDEIDEAIEMKQKADSIVQKFGYTAVKEKILLDGEIAIALGDYERAHFLLFDSTSTDARIFETRGLLESQKKYYKALNDYKAIYNIQEVQNKYLDSLQANVLYINENHKMALSRFSVNSLRNELEKYGTRVSELNHDRFAERLGIIFVIILAISTIILHLKNSRVHYEQKVEEEKNKLRNELADKIEEIRSKELMIKATSKRLSESINYAEHIQRSILPQPGALDMYDISGSFIFFSPLDIVSGDFYWFTQKGDNLILCCADCTGHGIPGAFMSMIASTIISDIINRSDSDILPSAILEELDVAVIDELGHNQSEDGAAKDGCDISIASINVKTKKVAIASAKRPVIVIKDQDMIDIKGTKRSIGDTEPVIRARKFEDTIMQLHTGDTIYMFSDGYSDQFGGQENERLNIKNIKRFLRAIHDDDMDEQGLTMQEFFTQWKGDYPQTDDVLFMGVML